MLPNKLHNGQGKQISHYEFQGTPSGELHEQLRNVALCESKLAKLATAT